MALSRGYISPHVPYGSRTDSSDIARFVGRTFLLYETGSILALWVLAWAGRGTF